MPNKEPLRVCASTLDAREQYANVLLLYTLIHGCLVYTFTWFPSGEVCLRMGQCQELDKNSCLLKYSLPLTFSML